MLQGNKAHALTSWNRPIVFEFISSLLSSAQSYSILLIERAVTALLKLCLLICDEVCLLSIDKQNARRSDGLAT